QPVTSTKRTIVLRPGWEWRFDIGFNSSSDVTVRLEAGTCERDGIELALRTTYKLRGTRSRLLSWHGCELEVDGRCESEGVVEFGTPAENGFANGLLNLHSCLNDMRAVAARGGAEGPRVLVTGGGPSAPLPENGHAAAGATASAGGGAPPPSTGKSTAVRTLASYATRQGHQPLVVNADPREGMLTLPGTLSAAVLATVMDPEAADAWGSTPTTGPSSVPVKLPIVHYYGHGDPARDDDGYRELTAKLAATVTARLTARDDGHVMASVNVIVVVGSSESEAELSRRFSNEKTSLGEPIQVVRIEPPPGVWQREEAFMQRSREAAIKEYFFGDARRTLSPQIQHMGFDEVGYTQLVKEEPSTLMQHWTLAIMHASTRDPPEVVRAASVMGYVYVSDVDEERRKIKLLSPVSGRLGDRPMVWGSWPEPHMNLLG
ncbi:polyribonucleotide 5'-hydroxyl-kinase, partial [Geosmithia morbida]